MRSIGDFFADLWDTIIDNKTIVIPVATVLVALTIAVVVAFSYMSPKEEKGADIIPVVHAVISDTGMVQDAGNFKVCTFSSDSVERDLTIYFTEPDDEETAISGYEFEVKLVNPKDCDQVFDKATTLSNITKQISEVEGTPQAQELEEKKQEALSLYADALDKVVGDTHTDSDKDGVIHIENLVAGDYVVCLMPSTNVGSTSYTMSVNVKDHVEYQAIKNITKKVAAYDASKDVQAHATQVEAAIVDTVAWVESSSNGGIAVLTAANIGGSMGVSTARNLTQKVLSNGSSGGQSSITYAWTDLAAGQTATADINGALSFDESNHTTSGTATIVAGTEGISVKRYMKYNNGEAIETIMYEVTGGGITLYTKTNPFSGARMITGQYCSVISPDGGNGAALSVAQSVTLLSSVDGHNTATVDIGRSSNLSIQAASSSDTGVCTVNCSGETLYITAADTDDDGAATVTVTAQLNDGSSFADGTDVLTVSCAVKVLGKNTQLTGADGQKLYIDEGGKTPACVKDYRDGNVFYSFTGDMKYTGWQIINGDRYYFDANGNPVTGQQVIQGVLYNFGPDGKLKVSGFGVDVSKYQGTIDWKQVSTAAGFAIIRCGGRYQQTGGLYEDPMFYTNMKGAKAAGISTGIYFFSTALNEAEAVEEASLAIKMAQNAGGCSLPIYIDMEDKVRGQSKLSNAQRTAIVNAFCSTVQNAGYKAGFYASKSWMSGMMNMGSIGSNVEIWVAQYNTKCDYTGRYNVWQYTSKGTVPGIKGSVDCNNRY